MADDAQTRPAHYGGEAAWYIERKIQQIQKTVKTENEKASGC